MDFTELQLNVNGLRIAALKHESGEKRRILCLHGWLDNANSFVPLIPHLSDATVVALDLPGHGHSEHHADTSPYALAHTAHIVLQAAQALGWNQFHLLGHSLGGCIAPFSAVASVDTIESIIMIDAAGPQAETADQLPGRLSRFHTELASLDRFNPRQFDAIEQAVSSRLKANKMTEASARLIVQRQLRQTDSGYQWRFDQKLRVPSATYFTEEQVQSVLKAVSCPVKCILASHGYIVERPESSSRLDCIQQLTTTTLPGNHHLHTDNPLPVAAEINSFLDSLSTK